LIGVCPLLSNPKLHPLTMDNHVHLYNICACGHINLYDNNPMNEDGPGGLLGGKTEADTKGKALVSVAITEKQKDRNKQYDDDSKSIGGSLQTMATSLDDLSADVKELGRCLKSSAVASQLLQRVQVRINKEIRGALDSEEKKMKVKDKRIDVLGRKLRKIQRNQAKIIFGYKVYQYLRYLVLILIVVVVVGSIMYSLIPPTPKIVPACTIGNGTVATTRTCDCGHTATCKNKQYCYSNHHRCSEYVQCNRNMTVANKKVCSCGTIDCKMNERCDLLLSKCTAGLRARR
jgi:hypothetical protein